MKISSALVALYICLTACAMKPKIEWDASMPRIHNIAPDFIEYWDRVKGKSQFDQLSFLESDFFPKFSHFYNYKIEKWKKAGRLPIEELSKALKEYPQIETEFKKKTNEISDNLNSAMDSFLKSVPDLNKNFDIYVTHSFGEMDGGTRKIGDKIYFVLGIDGMVKYHKDFKSEVPFLHHELFHIYHGQFLPDEQVLWIALWAEGLATYASEQLNPSASMTDLMLDVPEGIVSRIDKNLDYHWVDLTKKLTSTSNADYEAYFLMSSRDKKIVPRSGYYLGYLIAKEIGKTKSIPEMAQMKQDEILPMLKSAIEKVQKDQTKGVFKN
jgi:hypothetical protein